MTADRPRDAWSTPPPLVWGRCWFQTHESAGGPMVNAPCFDEWARRATAEGGEVVWLDGRGVAFRKVTR